VERVSVVLAGLPRMMADIVQRVLAEAPDFDVITWPNGLERVMDIAVEHSPDVVVTGLGPGQGIEPFVALLRAHPSLRILALEGDGRRAVMYELQPHAVPLGEVSTESLIDAIRSTARVRNA
jgi:DNA-binding NarL/FixJ family response regulator